VVNAYVQGIDVNLLTANITVKNAGFMEEFKNEKLTW